MAISNDFPVLDGIAPSWADIDAKMIPNGGTLIAMKDIQAINTNTTVEVGEQRGASGGRVMRRTTGAKTDEASMTVYATGYQTMVRNLMQAAPVRGNQRLISLVHSLLVVQHTPPGSDEIFEYRLKGLRVLGRTKNSTEGTDAETVEVALSVAEIVDIIDGVEVVML